MLKFSIMPLIEEHFEEYCEDIAYQVKSGIATMPLFCLPLSPEGDPAIDKADIGCRIYEKYKAKLDSIGIPSGILIQATIGHGGKPDHPSSFQKYVGLAEGTSLEICCPYDRDFQNYIRTAASRVAASHPDHIMLDDDFRLVGGRRQHGCACPLHMAELGKRLGKSITKETLWERLNRGDSECRTLFIQTQIDSLVECAKQIRRGIDSVDPSIPGSFCFSGDCAEGAYEIASIMAGKDNPVVIRVNNANYCATDPRDFVRSLHRAATQVAALTDAPDYLLAETDTCPQNRYSTPAAKLHSHFTFSILEGAQGAKHWVTRLTAFEPESGKAYRKKLATYNRFYDELARITPELIWLGCKIPVPPRPVYVLTPDDVPVLQNNGWCSHVLDRLGVPMHFSTKGEGACFFDGVRDQYFTDEELKTFLYGNMVLDAPAAISIIKRGFGKLLGVDVNPREADAKNASGELFYPEGMSVPLYDTHEILPLSDSVKRHSDVYHLCDGKTKEILFPGVTTYTNELGGTVAVYSGNTVFPYNYHHFGFLNETRKAQLVQILKDMDCLPIYYPGDAEVFMKAAKTQVGKLFCAILDMSLDAIEDLPLVLEKPVRRIQRLMPNGTYEDIVFTHEDGRIELSLTVYPFDPVILLIENS